MIKTLNKLGIKGNFLKLIKTIYEKSTVNIILNGERLEVFPLISEQGKNAHICHFYSESSEVLARSIRQGKQIKGIQTGKEEVKLSLFVDGIILYVENHKTTHKKNCYN